MALQRLRLALGASMFFSCLFVPAAIINYLSAGFSLYFFVDLASLVLLPLNLLALRKTRSHRAPGIIICLWMLILLSVLAWHEGGQFSTHRYVVVPLCASFLAGPRVVGMCTAVCLAEIAWILSHNLGQVPAPQTRYHLESGGATLLVGALAILYELSRGRAEQERDVAQGEYLRLVKEQMARVAARQALIAQHQALRADLSMALSEEGPLESSLQRCCAALIARLNVAFTRIWLLDAEGRAIELEASAQESSRREAPPSHAKMGPLVSQLAQEGRSYATNDLLGGALLEDRDWVQREGLVAAAGCPLMEGGRAIGAVAAFSSRTVDDDAMSVLGTAADAIVHGLERRRAREVLARRAQELARSNQELELFAYVASHDLQEPLRMVSSYTQLLARRYRGKLAADADEFIGFVVDGVNRMQQLILDLLDYSRVSTQDKSFSSVACEQVLRAVLRVLAPSIQESGALVTSDALPVVQGDELQLGQLLQNLLSNALKFREPGRPPRVHVSARRVGGSWVFSVQDNGIGIESAYLQRIFVLFQRLHSRADFPGTGIGLALCRKIVERHDGRIWVESTPGQGSTFSFTLPAASESLVGLTGGDAGRS